MDSGILAEEKEAENKELRKRFILVEKEKSAFETDLTVMRERFNHAMKIVTTQEEKERDIKEIERKAAEAKAKGLRPQGHPALKTMEELKKTAHGNPKALVQVSKQVKSRSGPDIGLGICIGIGLILRFKIQDTISLSLLVSCFMWSTALDSSGVL